MFRDEDDQLEEDFEQLIDTHGFDKLIEMNELTEAQVLVVLFRAGLLDLLE